MHASVCNKITVTSAKTLTNLNDIFNLLQQTRRLPRSWLWLYVDHLEFLRKMFVVSRVNITSFQADIKHLHNPLIL